MTFVWYLIAAFSEIAGCFAFWAWYGCISQCSG